MDIDNLKPDYLAYIKRNFVDSQVLIASSNKALRNNLKKVLSTMGFTLNNIGVCEDIRSAHQIIETHCPPIVIYAGSDNDQDIIPLVNLHKNLFPNRLKAFFLVVSEKDNRFFQNFKYDYDIEGVFLDTQNFGQLLNFFTSIFELNQVETKSQIFNSKIREFIFLGQFEKAKAFLQSSQDFKISDELKLEYLAKIDIYQHNFDDALKNLEKLCLSNNKNYFALTSMIEIFFQQKSFDLAWEYVNHFLKFYTCSEKNIPTFLKVMLFNKEYLHVIKFCEKYANEVNIDSAVKLNMAAALALCGKNIITDRPNAGKDALELAIKISGGMNLNIINMVITSIIESVKDIDYAAKIIEQYRINFQDSKQFLAIEFEISRRVKKPEEIIIEANNLLKKDIKTHSIYETLIEASHQLGRKRELIDDIVYEACKTFPEKCDYFKSLVH